MVAQAGEDLGAAFRRDLQALLDRYGATISAKDHWQGYPECGEDVRITVEIESVWSGSELVHTGAEIDLGAGMAPSKGE